MRILVILSFLFFIPTQTDLYSQNEIHIVNGCSFDDIMGNDDLYTFDPSEEADQILTEVMSFHSLPKNFILKSSNVKNAIATTLNGQRYILYNTSFLEKFKTDANTRWAAYAVLAHEIGHHLSGHDFSEKDPRVRKQMELEADKFAGGTLCLLGSTLEDAQAGIRTFALEGETATHPSKSSRLEAIASEWKAKSEWMRKNEIKPKPSITSTWKFDNSNAVKSTSIGRVGAPPKFGYCNSAALLTSIPEVKAADSDLQAFQTQLTKKGQEMVKALQDKAAELDRKEKQGTISPKDLEAQGLKLQEEQAAIGKYEEEVYKKLAEKREELFKPILNRVNKAMADVAKENQFMFVFDQNTQVLLYADESLDVTNLVKAKLGM